MTFCMYVPVLCTVFSSPATKLYHFMMCANHTVGDAAADMCLVEIALKTKGVSLAHGCITYRSIQSYTLARHDDG